MPLSLSPTFTLPHATTCTCCLYQQSLLLASAARRRLRAAWRRNRAALPSPGAACHLWR